MILLRPVALLFLALIAAATRVSAQPDSLDAVVGKRIRATFRVSPANDRISRVVGPLLRLDRDTLFLGGDRQHGEVAIPRAGLR